MPRYQDIARQLKTAIEQGELKPGARLPSSRTWSQELGVSRSTVESAYAELVAQGWLIRRGRQVPLSVSRYVHKNPLLMWWLLPVKASSRSHFKWDYPHSISFLVNCGRG